MKDNSLRAKIGTGKRTDIIDKNQLELPGPGKYVDETKAFGTGGPSFTIV